MAALILNIIQGHRAFRNAIAGPLGILCTDTLIIDGIVIEWVQFVDACLNTESQILQITKRNKLHHRSLTMCVFQEEAEKIFRHFQRIFLEHIAGRNSYSGEGNELRSFLHSFL